MAMTHPDDPSSRHRGGKPAAGRPVLFVLLLGLAAVGVLWLLVAGPSITVPLAVASAAGLMALVGLTWVVAGPRL
ncbi:MULTISPECIES: hypothetical protein [unclassified Brachybacterium]|uniref:hypothetical protein n=1 Tax=unclassified Brachybacterium TaxID=2623841 RepID=UPI0036232B78